MRSKWGIRFGLDWTRFVRGDSLFRLRFFLNFLGVLVTRKEVENGEVKKSERNGLELGFRVWVLVLVLVLVRTRRQAIEFWIRLRERERVRVLRERLLYMCFVLAKKHRWDWDLAKN